MNNMLKERFIAKYILYHDSEVFKYSIWIKDVGKQYKVWQWNWIENMRFLCITNNEVL